MTGQYDGLYQNAGSSFNIDPLFLKAQDIVESHEQANATSAAGAKGIAQFMPATAASAGPNGAPIDPTDPAQAVPAQARMMDDLIRKYTDPKTGVPNVSTALMEYHGGPDRSIWGPRTAAYPQHVAAVYAALRSAQPAAAPTSSEPTPFDQLMAKPDAAPAPPAQASTSTPSSQVTPFDTLMAQGQPPMAGGPNDPNAASPEVQAQHYATAEKYTPKPGGPLHPDDPSATVNPANVVPDMARAAVEGYQGTPALLSPEAQARLDNSSDLNLRSAGLLAHGANLGMGVLAGGFKAAQAGVSDIGNWVSPGLGNDLAGYAETLPYDSASVSTAAMAPAVKAAMADNRVANAATANARAAPLSPEFQANPMTPEAANQAMRTGYQERLRATYGPNQGFGNPEADRSPNPNLPAAKPIPTAPPITDSEVAAAKAAEKQQWANGTPPPDPGRYLPPPTSDAPSAPGMPFGEDTIFNAGGNRTLANARAKWENDQAQKAPTPGSDATEYVPGVRPTLAETSGDAQTAIEQKAIRQRNMQPFVEQETYNNGQRLNYYDQQAGDPVSTGILEQERDDAMNQALPAVWRNAAGAADARPVLNTIDSIMLSKDGKLTPVQDAMRQAQKAISDNKGNLETDPQILYGAREQINNLLGKNARAKDPTLADAAYQLSQVKDSLDQVIEKAAPGYRGVLNDYAEASKPIDAQRLLQTYRDKITDSMGVMQPERVDKMVTDIVNMRNRLPGWNQAKSLNDSQLQAIFNLRSDLVRQKYADNLARTKGSDSHQLFTQNSLMGISAPFMELGGHYMASHFGPFGNFAMAKLADQIRDNVQALKQEKIQARTSELLSPHPNWVGPHYAEGGPIAGPPSVGDNIPINASSGEYVLQRPAVQQLGVPAADALNEFHTLPPFRQAMIKNLLVAPVHNPLQHKTHYADGGAVVEESADADQDPDNQPDPTALPASDYINNMAVYEAQHRPRPHFADGGPIEDPLNNETGYGQPTDPTFGRALYATDSPLIPGYQPSLPGLLTTPKVMPSAPNAGIQADPAGTTYARPPLTGPAAMGANAPAEPPPLPKMFDVLTPQQRAVSEQLASGVGLKQIARNLNLSPSTVKTHVGASYDALGVDDRYALQAAKLNEDLGPFPSLVDHPDFANTPQRAQVADGILSGASTPEIADAMGLAPGTAKAHMALLQTDLGVTGGRAGLMSRLANMASDLARDQSAGGSNPLSVFFRGGQGNVASGLLNGKTPERIADDLDLDPAKVTQHLTTLAGKLGTSTDPTAITDALRQVQNRSAQPSAPPTPALLQNLNLTDQRVAHLTAQGATPRQIATQLAISPNVVQQRLANVLQTTGVPDSAALSARYQAAGIVPPANATFSEQPAAAFPSGKRIGRPLLGDTRGGGPNPLTQGVDPSQRPPPTSNPVPLNPVQTPRGTFSAAPPQATNFGPSYTSPPAFQPYSSSGPSLLTNRLAGLSSNPTPLRNDQYFWHGAPTGADPNAPTRFAAPVTTAPLGGEPARYIPNAPGQGAAPPPTSNYYAGNMRPIMQAGDPMAQYQSGDDYAKAQNRYLPIRPTDPQRVKDIAAAESQRLSNSWDAYMAKMTPRTSFGMKKPPGLRRGGLIDNALFGLAA